MICFQRISERIRVFGGGPLRFDKVGGHNQKFGKVAGLVFEQTDLESVRANNLDYFGSGLNPDHRNLVAGRGFEPPDLQVMSLASYRCSTPLLTVYLSRVISYVFGFFAGGNAELETGFRNPTNNKGERKSHAAREIGETGIRVAAVGCEYLGGESLRSQFGAGLKSSEQLNEPMERVGSSPATFSARSCKRTRPFPQCLAGGNA